MRQIELNLTKETALFFVDWLANDTYWGHTATYFDVEHGTERVDFVINGHTLSNVSNQHHHVIIDSGYVPAYRDYGVVVSNGKEYTPIEYCMHKLGY